MRIATTTRPGHEADDARAAEDVGAFGVLLDPGDGTGTIAGAAAATTTRATRLIVRVELGREHPVRLAEDIAVLDNISVGRVVALIDTGHLDVEAAREDLDLLVAALTPRPVQHAGARWRVPAGIDGHDAPERVEVTPKPVQVEIPVWLQGEVAAELALDRGLPRLATTLEEVDGDARVQPGRVTLHGEREADRDLLARWRDAGATHLVVEVEDPRTQLPEVGRYLIPEVAMPLFPRVVAEAMTPRPWTGPARYVPAPDGGQG